MLWGLVACLGSEPEPAPVPAPPTPARGDTVLVVVDTLRADHLGLYGYDRPTSPRLDAWAAGAVVFEDAQASSGWTLPSMATLMTGLLPHEHGALRDPDDVVLFAPVAAAHLTLAEVYRDAGHRTGAITNNTYLLPEFGLDQGFDHYDADGAEFGAHRSAEQSVDLALAWLSSSDQPAFLVLHVMEPHLDYDPPPPAAGVFTDGIEAPLAVPFMSHTVVNPIIEGTRETTPAERDYIVRRYDEEVLATDHALGRFFDALDARGRSTTVVLTADHGEEFWEHGGFEHGQHLLRELVHVPLVVKGPGVAARRVTEPVDHTDLFVSLVERSGASPVHASQGLALTDVLTGSGAVPTGRVLFGESCLYGAPCMSAARDGQRLVVRPTVGNAALYRRDEAGGEPVWEDPQARETVGRELFEAIARRRGGLEPVRVGEGGVRLEESTVEQLRSLGYVE